MTKTYDIISKYHLDIFERGKKPFIGPPHQSILDEFFNSFLVPEENSQSLLVQIQKSHILIFTETIILSSESANKKKEYCRPPPHALHTN